MESATCNKCFSSDYMLLNPDEAGFLDLAKVLFSSNLEKRKFVDCPDGAHEPSFGRRWIIFVSVVVQKMLKMVAKPLAGFGSGIEHWLNLLSGNGGFFGLAANYLKGKVVHPDRTSANFLSFIGCIDKRRELDPTISHVDCRYYAALSVMAAKASYENHQYIQSIVNDQWEMEYLGSFDFWNGEDLLGDVTVPLRNHSVGLHYQEKATTQAFALQDNNDVVIVSFRGTETFDSDAWSTDADISWYDLPTAGKIHGGFLKSLGLQKNQGWPREQDHHKPPTAYYAIRKLLRETLEQNPNSKFILTGHSLGGALAVLFPAVLGLHGESSLLDRLEAVYTFGQPRVGDEKFKQYMESLMEKHKISYYRFVYSYDVVPRLPYDDSTLMFKHFGTCIYYNSFYEGKVVAEEPNKNYFSLIWLLPKIANACWELMRSFVIGYTRGKDYREGGLLRILRFAGLLVAGIPAHCPQDYVNSTRLGKPDVFLSAIGRENLKILKTK